MGNIFVWRHWLGRTSHFLIGAAAVVYSICEMRHIPYPHWLPVAWLITIAAVLVLYGFTIAICRRRRSGGVATRGVYNPDFTRAAMRGWDGRWYGWKPGRWTLIRFATEEDVWAFVGTPKFVEGLYHGDPNYPFRDYRRLLSDRRWAKKCLELILDSADAEVDMDPRTEAAREAMISVRYLKADGKKLLAHDLAQAWNEGVGPLVVDHIPLPGLKQFVADTIMTA